MGELKTGMSKVAIRSYLWLNFRMSWRKTILYEVSQSHTLTQGVLFFLLNSRLNFNVLPETYKSIAQDCLCIVWLTQEKNWQGLCAHKIYDIQKLSNMVTLSPIQSNILCMPSIIHGYDLIISIPNWYMTIRLDM